MLFRSMEVLRNYELVDDVDLNGWDDDCVDDGDDEGEAMMMTMRIWMMRMMMMMMTDRKSVV